MYKKLAVIFSLLLSMVLVGCGSTEVEEKEGTVTASTNDTAVTATAEEPTAEEPTEEEATEEEATEETNTEEVNQLIIDDKNIKATLVSIVEETDDIWGKSINVTFEVENKTAKTITVQAREISADNKMVDTALYSMSTDISPGKLADCVLKIKEREGYTFPKLEENLEMKLHIFSWDDYDFKLDYPVNVTF